MEPSIVRAGVATPAIVEGNQFYDLARVDLNGNTPATIERGWNVWVGNVHLQSDQTTRIDSNSLSIVVSEGLAIGKYDLSVRDPRGQLRTLSLALTVVAGSDTTVPNVNGGASFGGAGATTSRSDGGSSDNTLSSSGGTETVGGSANAAGGGVANLTNGGTEAIGGMANSAGGNAANLTNGGTETVGGVANSAGGSIANLTNGGTETVGGVANSAGGSVVSAGSSGTRAVGGTTGAGGSTPACPNGTCDPGESPCSCPADCKPPSCGDAGSPQPCDANDPSLVACYRFESSVQPGKDDSQYGNNATSKNVSLISGHDGNSISLGASSVVNVAKSQSLDVSYVTIETWVYVAKTPSGTRAGLLDSEGQYGLFLLKAGVLWCSMTTTAGANAAQTTTVVNLLEWTHVACTYDGVNIKIFINGVEQATAAAAGNLSTAGTTGSTIGANNPSGDNLVGMLDDLRIWNVAHTANQFCEAAHPCTP